ncbi:hypothetical protein GCM10009727_48080 [Actinomadura napierensis]|uniref:Transposase n=1 Tax=Actinomadura napierensis TaxID=267854 RepID=A0ABP5LKF3_9ACTN
MRHPKEARSPLRLTNTCQQSQYRFPYAAASAHCRSRCARSTAINTNAPGGRCRHRIAQVLHGRVWAKLHRIVLNELGAAGRFDWRGARPAVADTDSVSVWAAHGGADEPESCRPGKSQSKIHVLVDRAGLPTFVGISAANTHDKLGLEPLVHSIPPAHSWHGAPAPTSGTAG